MGTLRVKKAFLRKVKVGDVIEELKADDYFFKSHREMMACVKETTAYKQMREVAVKHMLDTLENTARWPDTYRREEKKQQIANIGFLALEINSSISKTISERLNQEATVTIKRALKRLSDKRSKSSDSLNKRGRKRKQNSSSGIPPRTKDQNKTIEEEDSESDVSLDGVSESVSSVHTSDLSSFDDEIVVSSEDEKGVKKEKRISFRTANKAYFDDGFSNIRNVCQKDNTSEASNNSKTEEKSLTNASKFEKSENNISRPQRERKPNSKYSE